MSIEQTNQLILLILNSVLMTLLSSLLLGGAWLRQNTLLQQLHKTRSHYRKLTRSSSTTSTTVSTTVVTQTENRPSNTHPTELKQVRDRRQQLSQQYQWSHIGMLLMHTTLLTFSVSLFALALRSLLAFDQLISAALFLFTVGAAGLLAGTGCVLVDFAKGNSNSDSLGQTLGNLIRQMSLQWKRQALQIKSVKALEKEPRS